MDIIVPEIRLPRSFGRTDYRFLLPLRQLTTVAQIDQMPAAFVEVVAIYRYHRPHPVIESDAFFLFDGVELTYLPNPSAVFCHCSNPDDKPVTFVLQCQVCGRIRKREED